MKLHEVVELTDDDPLIFAVVNDMLDAKKLVFASFTATKTNANNAIRLHVKVSGEVLELSRQRPGRYLLKTFGGGWHKTSTPLSTGELEELHLVRNPAVADGWLLTDTPQ